MNTIKKMCSESQWEIRKLHSHFLNKKQTSVCHEMPKHLNAQKICVCVCLCEDTFLKCYTLSFVGGHLLTDCHCNILWTMSGCYTYGNHYNPFSMYTLIVYNSNIFLSSLLKVYNIYIFFLSSMLNVQNINFVSLQHTKCI